MKSICLLFIIFLAHGSILAQCDPKIEAADVFGNLKYQNRGQHCEGFYKSKVSANDLVFVSFTRGPLRYSSEEPEQISLSIPVDVDQPVSIRGFGIPRDLYYRLDIPLEEGQTFDWNTGDVLLKNVETRYARFIGLLGFIGELNSNTTYVPVSTGTATDKSSYLLQCVSSTRATEIKWRIVGHTEFKCINNCRSIRAGKAIKIKLPEDLPSGTYTLEVQGKEAHDGITPIACEIKIKL